MATIGVYYDKLLEDVNIRHPTKYPAKLLFENYNFYKKFYENSNRKLQIGGSKYKDYNYNDCTIRVYTRKEDDRYVYAVHDKDNEDAQECILIFITKNEKDIPFAYIENISAYDNCYKCASMKTKTGTFLLTFMLNLIKNKLKDRYKLKYIQLRDNSLYYCKSNNKHIKFSAFYMLTRGDTWYGKYGFVPYDEIKNDKNIINSLKYKKNNKLVSETKLNQVNVAKLIYNAMKKLEILKKSSHEKITKLVKDNENKTIKDFLYDFTKKFDISCAIFSSFYEDLMNELQMDDMHGWTYYMPLD